MIRTTTQVGLAGAVFLCPSAPRKWRKEGRMMKSGMDYWVHKARTEGQPQITENGDTVLPPHTAQGNQAAFSPGLAPGPLAHAATAPAVPQFAALSPRRPTMPLRPKLNLSDPRAIQAAFLRGELDSEA